MTPSQRTQLTKALSAHVAAIAADLRNQMLTPGLVRQRAERLRADEQVGEDFEVWTDLLSRRAAVLWVLKTVYVRVLEDGGLLRPGRLLDPEGQQLFETLAPNLGETAFLAWVFRDLASPRGGLPELFAPQPAEVTMPSNRLSRDLIDFWRAKDADTAFQWTFANEAFAGELMGDLYQELDPVVKERYALCQTPDFVRGFILGQTLEPAIRELGADKVRVLDPACGSGHFLLDALRRLVESTGAQHPDWSRRQVVDHALDRVVGLDINDYACALARARLVMTAAELAGMTSLANAASFHPHVYWADGLEQIERDEEREPVQLDFLSPNRESPLRAVLTRPHVRAILGPILKAKFQVVVGNPPYITERDEARREYHRRKVGKRRRYLSAFREYSLAAPFIERSLQLVEPMGRIGLIVGNNFMKREFGKPLIEEVLAGVDLQLVVDTSQASIPHHGTSTVILFACNRAPLEATVRAVMGKRGETGTPEEPARGKVWSSIVEGLATSGFENEFVSVADVPRETFKRHPWSLGGGGAAELRQDLERGAPSLAEMVLRIGYMTIMKQDEVFLGGPRDVLREGVVSLIDLVEGPRVRDYAIDSRPNCLFPYDRSDPQMVLGLPPESAAYRHYWRYRLPLRERTSTGFRTIAARGVRFYEYAFYFPETVTSRSIAFPFLATHNHFVFDRGGKVFNRSAPVIKLPSEATEADHLALLGILNSSTACFWIKQVCQPKGGESTGTKKQSEAWARRIEIDATKLSRLPTTDARRSDILVIACELDRLGREYSELQPSRVLEKSWPVGTLAARTQQAAAQRVQLRRRMIALQERLDWTVYVAYGLAPSDILSTSESWPLELSSEHRVFAIRMARAIRSGSLQTHWFDAHHATETPEVPAELPTASRELWESLLRESESNLEIALLERPDYKRKWEPPDESADLKKACWHSISNRVEAVAQTRQHPMTLQQMVVSLQDDAALLELAELYVGRRDFDLPALIGGVLNAWAVPNHSFHVYTDIGLGKRATWEEAWRLQRLEDEGKKVESFPELPEYSQGSRGKSVDFKRTEFWRLRGPLDVPKEIFIAFTEVPGRGAGETLFGWAGWTPTERVKALLALDEECEDQGLPLADRIAILDSAWGLLPDIARYDRSTAARLKAELQALVGPDGPSKVLLDDWKRRFPALGAPGARARKVTIPAAAELDDEDDE